MHITSNTKPNGRLKQETLLFQPVEEGNDLVDDIVIFDAIYLTNAPKRIASVANTSKGSL